MAFKKAKGLTNKPGTGPQMSKRGSHKGNKAPPKQLKSLVGPSHKQLKTLAVKGRPQFLTQPGGKPTQNISLNPKGFTQRKSQAGEDEITRRIRVATAK